MAKAALQFPVKTKYYATPSASRAATSASAWMKRNLNKSEHDILHNIFVGPKEKQLKNVLTRRFKLTTTPASMQYSAGGRMIIKDAITKGRTAAEIAGVAKTSAASIYAPISSVSMFQSMQDLFYSGPKTRGARGPTAGFWRFMGNKLTKRIPLKTFGKKMTLFEKAGVGIGNLGSGLMPRTPFGRIKGAGMVIGAVIGGIQVARTLGRAVSWTGQDKYRHVGSGGGPGYTTWSKKNGMPANHLSTDNLSNSLHNMRHTSII